MRARLGPRLALALASGLLTLLCVEAVLRGCGERPFPDWSPRGLHVADTELGIVPAAHAHVVQEGAEFRVAIRTDALGLRADERPAHADPVVLLIGDSFAFGHGVGDDDVVSAQLQRALRDQGRARAWVANAGVISYGTTQAAARFSRLAPTLRPELCVLLFFEGNDPFDELREPLTVDRGYVVRRGERVSAARRVKLWFKHRSALYRRVAALVDRAPPDAGGLIAGDHPAFGFDLFRRDLPAHAARALAATDAALAELKRATDAAGAALLVAVVPARCRAIPSEWQRHCERFALAPHDYDLRQVARRVAQRCAALGIPCIDLIDDVGDGYYRELLEVHLDARGHARIAQRLARWIVERNGPPR